MAKTHRRSSSFLLDNIKPRNKQLHEVLSGTKGGPMKDRRRDVEDEFFDTLENELEEPHDDSEA